MPNCAAMPEASTRITIDASRPRHRIGAYRLSGGRAPSRSPGARHHGSVDNPTEQSGLFAHLLPRFTQKAGIAVKVVALGTGQALDVGRRGDADVVFVHDKPAEQKFVADGFGLKRHEVMYNDFVVVGPKSDPAGVAGKDIQAGLRRIAAVKAPFVSRGD